MKLTPKQRQEAQAILEERGWRTVDTGSGYWLEPPERVKLYDEGFVYPLGHPGILPDPFPFIELTPNRNEH